MTFRGKCESETLPLQKIEQKYMIQFKTHGKQYTVSYSLNLCIFWAYNQFLLLLIQWERPFLKISKMANFENEISTWNVSSSNNCKKLYHSFRISQQTLYCYLLIEYLHLLSLESARHGVYLMRKYSLKMVKAPNSAQKWYFPSICPDFQTSLQWSKMMFLINFQVFSMQNQLL